MRWAKKLRLRCRSLFRGSRVETELDEELRYHVERQIEANIRAGMTPEEARFAARREFGGVEQFKEECRDRRGVSWIETLGKDHRYGARLLARSPGFTVVAVLTLGIGIGANTAIFSVVNGVLLQPLRFDEADDLVAIHTYFQPKSGYDFPEYPVGSPEYFDYKNQNRTMEEVAAVSSTSITMIAGDGGPEVIRGAVVSSSMFTVLRAAPLLGRTLIAADDGAKPAPVIVLSHGLWQRRFGGDPAVVGRRLQLTPGASGDPVLTEIVGIMPEDFDFPSPAVRFWIPLPLDPARTWRGGHWFWMIGRLARGVTFEQADAQMRVMMVNWAETYPDHHVGHGLFMRPLRDEMVREARPTLLLLMGAVGFVLLIACANVSSLLLARGESRRRDLAVRSALGAGRRRLLQQQLSESLLLAVLGGAVGLFLAGAGTRALQALEAGLLSGRNPIGLDGRVLVFTACIVGLTTLIFGMVPALQAATPDLTVAFKDSSRSAAGGTKQMRFRKLIVVTEIALAVLLVVGAGLMVKSYARLVSEDPGFRTGNLLFAALNLPGARYTPEQGVAFFDRLREEAAALPGVESVTLTSPAPLGEDRRQSRFHIEGREVARAGEFCCTGGHVMVGPRFFETMGIPLLRGRLLIAEDHRAEASHVVVIDDLMARRFWPGGDAIGKRVRFAHIEGPWHTIVGVVGNVTFNAPGVEFPTLYHSHAQSLSWAGDLMARSAVIAIRTTGDPNLLARPFRELVRGLDPQQAIASIATMDEILTSSVAGPRFIMTLFTVFAGLALALGAIGVYGVISYSVARRTAELGIRQALGASCTTLVRMVLREGGTLAGVGILVGLAAALAVTRLLTGFLHEVSPADPWTFFVVALGVSATAVLASYLPARRATKVDPTVALRHE